jgi:hypothetical protein
MSPSIKNGSNFAAFDNLLEGCQIIDFEWRYIYLNDTAIVHAHRDRQELIGKTMMECYPGIEKTPVFAVLERVMGDRKAERLENEGEYPLTASKTKSTRRAKTQYCVFLHDLLY